MTWTVEVGNPGPPRSSLLGSVSADVSRPALPVVVVPPGADAIVDERMNGGQVDE